MSKEGNKAIEKINKEFIMLKDTGKSRLFKKYNLSLYDIYILKGLVEGKYKEFINKNVYVFLKDLGLPATEIGVGFIFERS